SEANRDALVAAAASYGAAAVAAKGNSKLPDEVGRALIAAVTPGPKASSKPKSTAKKPVRTKSPKAKPKSPASAKAKGKPSAKPKTATKKRKT
ncbi:MAG TPA: hypothetical protein VNA87_02760, partial [Actinomycetota bacterium]|nr:hypothetical protein [Actinomycetota bacterium]